MFHIIMHLFNKLLFAPQEPFETVKIKRRRFPAAVVSGLRRIFGNVNKTSVQILFFRTLKWKRDVFLIFEN